MKSIDIEVLKKFLKLAGSDLKGDWVLIGGTVLPLLGSRLRVTTDIDLISISNDRQNQTLELMNLAERLGLPIEAINQAGAYFLSKIEDYEKQLILLHEGPNARIFRPNLNLFLNLKIKRLSESDLQDCLAFIDFSRRAREIEDISKLESLIRHELKTSGEEKKTRLEQLLLRLRAI